MPSNTLGHVEQSLGPCRQMTKPVLILTRPAPAAQRFADTLPDLFMDRVRLVISPLMQIIATGAAVDMAGYAGVIFSSSNGVAHGPKGDGRVAYCVGDATAQAARAHGWQADVLGQDADDLVATLRQTRPDAPLLHIGGSHQRGDIAERLTAAGLPTQAVAVYDQVLLPLSEQAQAALAGHAVCIVPLFSPRTATQFVTSAAETQNVVAVALSRAVADRLDGASLKGLRIAAEPTAVSMRLALETAVNWDSLP